MRGNVFLAPIMARQIPQAARFLLGQVFGKTTKQTANVRVSNLELDEYVLKYYKTPKELFVHDPKEETESGDVVLIQELPVPRSTEVNHILSKIVYKIGRTVDPVTGRRCTHYSYLDEDPQATGRESLSMDTGSPESQQLTQDEDRLNLHGQSKINEGTPV